VVIFSPDQNTVHEQQFFVSILWHWDSRNFPTKQPILVEFTLYKQNLPNFSCAFFFKWWQNVSKRNTIVHEDCVQLYSNDQKSQIPLHTNCWFSPKKIDFTKLPKICWKYTCFTGKARFSEEIIAKYYHRKTHWFEHTHDTHVPKP
jgi:hypothetical protein